jgi:hypothetical protein
MTQGIGAADIRSTHVPCVTHNIKSGVGNSLMQIKSGARIGRHLSGLQARLGLADPDAGPIPDHDCPDT